MLQIHDVSTVPAPIPGNSSLSLQVSCGVIARNAQHNDQDIRQVLINLPPFFSLTLQCSFDTAGMYA
jgi:hypothetical protein